MPWKTKLTLFALKIALSCGIISVGFWELYLIWVYRSKFLPISQYLHFHCWFGRTHHDCGLKWLSNWIPAGRLLVKASNNRTRKQCMSSSQPKHRWRGAPFLNFFLILSNATQTLTILRKIIELNAYQWALKPLPHWSVNPEMKRSSGFRVTTKCRQLALCSL